MASILEIDPREAGLGAASSVLGRLSQPSRVPVGLGSILGQMGGAYEGAQNEAILRGEQLKSQRELRAAQAEAIREKAQARAELLAEKQAQAQKVAKFNSILGEQVQAGKQPDEISILGAGIESGAFGPRETTEFMSKVMEKKSAREQRLEELRIKSEDQKIAREERESFQRQMFDLQKQAREDSIRLAASLKPAPQGMAQAKPPAGFRWKEDQPDVLEPVPGGPAGKLSAEAAGRASLMDAAYKDLDYVESALIKDNKLDMGLVLAINIPGVSGMPGNTEARKVYSAIENAIAAKLRMETGAATNPGEIKNTAARFKPTIGDTAESAKDKIDRLREFMKMGLEQMKVEGYVGAGNEDKFKTGNIYTDANGNKAQYLGNGKWKEVK